MKALLSSIILVTTLAQANDPMFDQQWGLQNQGQRIWRAEGNIRREAINGTPGVDARWPGVNSLVELGAGREVIVAVIDSGIDMGHPEFAGRLYQGKDFLDNAAMVDDIGHGTHVAGIIAANTDGVGIQGVTPPNVKILPLKVLSQKLEGNFFYKTNPSDANERPRVITDIIANAIVYALDSHASVINLSLGWPQQIHGPRVQKALDLAYQRGVVVVAASGNNNKDVPLWPCAHPTVICVGAMDNQGKLTEYSNHGGKVDLVAPGEWIVSTYPRSMESRTLRIQGYEAKNGSSQAAPYVAAAAALLKLQDPNISLSSLKAKLYSSSTALRTKDERFVRFGALSIEGALKASDSVALASVLVKDVKTVGVNHDGVYDFKLPIEILGQTQSSPQVQLEGLPAEVVVEGNDLRIRGRFADMTLDTEIPVTFKTTIDGKTTVTKAALSFARTISESDLINVSLAQLPGNSLVALGMLKQTRVGYVAVEDRPSSDFHGYTITRTNKDIKVTSIRANADGTPAKIREHDVPQYKQLLMVIEKDVNLDGRNDIIFYGKNSDDDHLVLTFANMDGTPLFGKHSRWELPITGFKDLPIEDGGARAGFSWIKHKTFLGDLLLPYYMKSWQMPEEDNSRELLYREDSQAIDKRLYYWEPYLVGSQAKVRPRVVDSIAVKRDLNKRLNVMPWESVSIENILPQSQAERSIGSTRHLVSVGEGFFRRFYVLKVPRVGQYTIEPHSDNDSFLTGNTPLAIRSLKDFSYTANSFMLALVNRSTARIKPFVEGQALEPWTLQTSGWSNLFANVVATFESNDRRTLFFESRYHVYVHDQQGGATGVHKLPINRDSSFPGVSFSETLQPALVRVGQQNSPAVAVNSTLIYGDRFYTMLSTPEAFTRPVALSIKIPENCIALRGQMLSVSLGYSAYTMLCQRSTGEVDMSFFPLEMP